MSNVYQFSCNIDEFDWKVEIKSPTIESAYNQLDEFDRINADFVHCNGRNWLIRKFSNIVFQEFANEELPF